MDEDQLLSMTTTSSPEAVADPAGSSAAAPYGTRSRGRNAPRPNYAEDRDMEVDFEAAPAKGAKRNSGVALTNIVNGSKSDTEKSSPTLPRKTLPNGASSNALPKESIPGTSSFSARPDDVNGTGSLRKRKATASNPTSSNNAKKIDDQLPEQWSSAYYSNMVSFDSSEPILKNGHITADDGTTFALNGKLIFFLHFLPFVPNLADLRKKAFSAGETPKNETRLINFRSCLFNLRTARRAILSGSNYGIFAIQD